MAHDVSGPAGGSIGPAPGARGREEPALIGRPIVTAVIPAMNEERNIGWVLARLPDLVDEVVVVDAYSTDATVEVVRAERPDAVVVPQIGRGKGAALRTAFAAAAGEYVVTLDSDCSMHPAEIVRYVETLDRGYDFVKGSRYLPGGGSNDLTWLRSAGNRTLTTSVNALFMVPLTDLCYGFFAFRRNRLPELALAGRGFEIETEIVLRAIKARLRIAEVPSVEHRRRHGTSNLRTFRDGGRVLCKIIRERVARRASTVVDHVQLPHLEAGATAPRTTRLREAAPLAASTSAPGSPGTDGTRTPQSLAPAGDFGQAPGHGARASENLLASRRASK
jgi:hypothetical protein